VFFFLHKKGDLFVLLVVGLLEGGFMVSHRYDAGLSWSIGYSSYRRLARPRKHLIQVTHAAAIA